MSEENMSEYKVLKDVEFPNGTIHEEGSVIFLTEAEAESFAEGLIEPIDVKKAEVGEVKTEEIGEDDDKDLSEGVTDEALKAGSEMTIEEKKEAIAEANAQGVGQTSDEVKAEVSEESSVFDGNGNFIRTYSKEIHGEDYLELAEQFVSNHEGYSIK